MTEQLLDIDSDVLVDIMCITPFYDKMELARIYYSRADDEYYFTNSITGDEHAEYLYATNIQEAKREVANIILRNLEDEVDYYVYLINTIETKVERRDM